MNDFLARVDVDGDGTSSSSDRAVFQWWLASGGDLGAAMACADSAGGVFDLSTFFASDGASEVADGASATEIPPTSSGGEGFGPEGLEGGGEGNGPSLNLINPDSDCVYEVLNYEGGTLPQTDIVVDDSFVSPIAPNFASIGAALAYVQSTGSPEPIVKVMGGTYVENIVLEFESINGSLTLFAPDGPDSTIITSAAASTPVVWVRPGTGGGLVSQFIRLGLVKSDVVGLNTAPPAGHPDWHGFTITGAHGTGYGVGIFVEGVTGGQWPDVFEVRGCVITGNDTIGGVAAGVRVFSAYAVRFLLNEISENRGDQGASGMFARDSNLLVAKNWFIANEPRAQSTFQSEPGGGLRATSVHLQLCENVFFQNVGLFGSGAHLTVSIGEPPLVGSPDCVEYPETQVLPRIHVERNQFFENSSSELTNYASQERMGGGLAVVSGCAYGSLGKDPFWRLAIRNNEFRLNRIESVPSNESGGSGGGLSVRVDLDLGWNPPVDIVGNMSHRNYAERAGGGIYLECTSPDDNNTLDFFNNTMTSNICGGSSESGSGIYLDERARYASRVNAANNIIVDNEPPQTQWHVEGAGTGPDPLEWRYSHIPPWNTTSPSGTGFDIFGSGNANSTASPGIDLSPSPPYLDGSGATIDGADPTLFVDTAYTPLDINGDPRRLLQLTGLPGTGAEIDRGADEFTPDAEPFKRGDANADTAINISDAVYVLDFLFVTGPAPVCIDSGDVNDDGSLDITDPVYLLAYLFSTGAPPEPPFPSCGDDPTSDNNRNCAPYSPC